jgi:hypothetical protein
MFGAVSDSVPAKVEFLWWRECPSWERALAELREEMKRAGLDPDAVELHEVLTQAEAEREAFVGSPTIRIDGRDLQPPEDEPLGLGCRVYRLRDGRLSPIPDRDDVRAALQGRVARAGAR